MNCRLSLSLVIFLLSLSITSSAQKQKKADKKVIEHLFLHINYLSDNQLAAAPKEKMEYICNQFRKNGIEPKGDKGGYYKVTEIQEGKQMGNSSYLFINGEEIITNGYFPLLSCPELLLEAAPSLALQEPDEPWFLDLKEIMEIHDGDSLFQIKDYLIDQTRHAASKGATALFVYNSSDIEDKLTFDGKTEIDISIPLIYVKKEVALKYFAEETAILDIKLRTAFAPRNRVSEHIVGYINNNAPNTVIIGAEEDAADAAALIEIGSLLKNSKSKNNNYMLVAFLDEEVENPVLKEQPSYMVNMRQAGDTDKLQYIYTIVEKAL